MFYQMIITCQVFIGRSNFYGYRQVLRASSLVYSTRVYRSNVIPPNSANSSDHMLKEQPRTVFIAQSSVHSRD